MNIDRIVVVDALAVPEQLLIHLFHELVHAVQDSYEAAMLHTELGELPADTPLPRTPSSGPRRRNSVVGGVRPAPVRVRRHGVAD